METKVDVEDEIDTSKLDFQDFPQNKGKVQTHTFTDFPPTAESEEDDVYDKSELLKEEKPESKTSFWTFEYYQQFFDVESTDVFYRVLGSMIPHPNRNYLKTKIRPNPDLYGPFWICTTLVFTTAIAGNLANYLSIGSSDTYNWKYDFHKVSFAATAIFSYWWVVPASIFGFLWWTGNQIGYTFLEILCAYGYSLAIFIPISILWVVQFTWFQWILVIVGTLLSGGVLVIIFLPAVRETTKKYTWLLLVVVFVLHASLAVGFKLYFFHIPPPSTIQNPSNISQPIEQIITRNPVQNIPQAQKENPKSQPVNQLSQQLPNAKGKTKDQADQASNKQNPKFADQNSKQPEGSQRPQDVATSVKGQTTNSEQPKQQQKRTVNKQRTKQIVKQ